MAGTISGLRRIARLAAPLVVGWLTLAGVAHAQSMGANSASFNAGYNRTPDQENSPINVQLGDVNGVTVINSLITGAEPNSIFASGSSGAAGALDGFSGAGGGGSASAIGANLSVVTQGDNTVIVTSSQSNSRK